MRVAVCGVELKPTRTDLPFKVGDTRIVILKNLPVVQCGSCPEYLLEDDGRADRAPLSRSVGRHSVTRAVVMMRLLL